MKGLVFESRELSPKLTGRHSGQTPDGKSAVLWALLLAIVIGSIAYCIQQQCQQELVIIVGLLIFDAVFAVNSSLHSYLIVSYTKGDGVFLGVGFYYMPI